MEIDLLEQKLLTGTNVDTDGRRQHTHNIIQPQTFLRSFKNPQMFNHSKFILPSIQ